MLAMTFLDRHSLNICINNSPTKHFLGQEEEISDLFNLMLSGREQVAINKIGILDDSKKVNTALFVSNVWHEKRHFIDQVLTSFGAHNMTLFFESIHNAPGILAESRLEGKIVFPISVYADAVRCELLEIKYDNKTLKNKIGSIWASRQKSLDQDKRNLLNDPRYRLSNESFFEAMAVMCQTSGLEYHFGIKTSVQVQEKLKKLGYDDRYTWFNWFGDIQGEIKATETDAFTSIANSNSIFPVCFAALCSEIVSKDKYKLNGAGIPLDRFLYLFNYIKTEVPNFEKLDVEDSFELSNRACEKIWGTSLITSLLIDYDRQERNLGKFKDSRKSSTVAQLAFEDFHELRGKMLRSFLKDPLLFVDPKRFTLDLSAITCPDFIIVSPQGNIGTPDKDFSLLLADSKKNGVDEILWWWAVHKKDSNADSEKFFLKDRQTWHSIFQFWGPLYKLMLHGRNTSGWIGPELLFTETVLDTGGMKVDFDPFFEFPNEIPQEVYRKWFLGSEKFVWCDLTGEEISVEDAYFVSPWTVKYSSVNSSFFRKYFPLDILFDMDWTVWIIKKDLLVHLEEVAFTKPANNTNTQL